MTSTRFAGAGRSPRSTGVARADEPGSGRVSGARALDLPRWPLASLASAELAEAKLIVAVLCGSSLSTGAKLPAAPLGGSDTKLHGVSGASGTSTVGGSITAGTDIAACSDDRLMIHVSSFSDGNGLDSASGTATKNTRTPHNAPASTMAEREIRSADLAA